MEEFCTNCASRLDGEHSELCPKGKAINKGHQLLAQVLYENTPKPRRHGRRKK